MTHISDALERLQVQFRRRAARDLDDLRRWSTDQEARSEELRLLVHRLAGAGGTFGFHRLSALAAAAEDAIVTHAADRLSAVSAVIKELQQLSRLG